MQLELELQKTNRDLKKLQSEVQKTSEELKKLRSERADKAMQKSVDDARIKELEGVLASHQSKIASNTALTAAVMKLKTSLEAKETENSKLLSDKEKLELYTKKSLHGVQEKYMLAVNTLKQQVQEEELKYQRLKDKYKQFQVQSQRENQLLSSVVYELGMNVTEHRLVTNFDRSGSTGSAHSKS